MKAPLAWIKEFVPLPPLEQLIERLNATGTSVAGNEKFGEGLEKIIVGEILSVNPHPHADKLQLAQVRVPGQVLEIVCGAKNIEAGQKVPVAPVGSTVPFGVGGAPLKIERRKIREIESNGMLCSARELGLGDDQSGILILDPLLKIGTKLNRALALPDTILEVEVTTNRGDELSIYGLAREIAAVTEKRLKPLTAPEIKVSSAKVSLTSQINDPKLCRRYSLVAISNIKLGPSPSFIQNRLRQAGLRPIVNVVDITNYVMLLTGQPLHAFDYSKIASNKLIIRESKPGDKLITLDGSSRQLGFGSVLITDTEKVLGLAGVMGGEESGITATTDTIVLEGAVFDPVSTRRMMMKLGLRTEAGHRFERGVDPEQTLTALQIAADLILKYAEGRIASPVIDYYPLSHKAAEVTLSKNRLDQYLGYDLKLSQATNILIRLGFRPTRSGVTKTTYLVPSWRRRDVSIEEDLIEEVARVSGYSQIPDHYPEGVLVPMPQSPWPARLLTLKTHLSSLGLNEVQTYSFVSDDLLIGEDRALKISNPISNEWVYLKTSLIPSLAQTAQLNLNVYGSAKIFELSKIYLPQENDLPLEKYCLGLVGESFAEVKGYGESLLSRLGLPMANYKNCSSHYLSEAAEVNVQGQIIGMVGELNGLYLAKTGLKRNLWFGELDITKLVKLLPKEKHFTPVPRFPLVKEDISLLVNLKTPVAEIVRAAASAGSDLLVDIEPLEIFGSQKIGPGKKSVSLRLSFQSPKKTLTYQEIKEERTRIEKFLKKELKAIIR